jgi:very-short-patch-repair endonuclease
MKWLDDNNIQYINQKSFEDCKSPKNWSMRFDFYIPSKNLLIEFDGKQHYYSGQVMNRKHTTTDEDFNYQIRKDKIKNEYCKINNIDLLRISYVEISNVDNILKGKIYG